MSTGAAYANITAKKLLGAEDFSDRILDYVRNRVTEGIQVGYSTDGVFNTGLTLAADGNDKFKINGTSKATDGLGNILVAANAVHTAIQFENTNAIPYYVGLKYADIPNGIVVNPRTGMPDYLEWQEGIGEASTPDSVIDNGNGTITFRVDNVCETGVSNAGRQVLVYKNVPAKDATIPSVAIETRTVAFTGGQNRITTAGTLGQSAISTSAADYTVILLGPTVKRNTDLRLSSVHTFVGIVTGAGAGSPPVSFNVSDQSVFSISLFQFANITRIDSHGSLKVQVKADAFDNDEPQISVQNFAGSTTFTIDEDGDVVTDGNIQVNGNLTVNGTTTQNNVVTVNSSETITDNLTAGNAAGDTHTIKGTWDHQNAAGGTHYLYVNGTTGRVGIGGVDDGANTLTVGGNANVTGAVITSSTYTANGSLAFPAYSFSSTANSGMALIGGQLQFSIAGVLRGYVGTVGMVAGAFGVGFANSYIQSPSSGVITFTDNTDTTFTRLVLGQNTSSFVAAKRSGTTFAIRLGDDSGDADLSAKSITTTLTGAGTAYRALGANNDITVSIETGGAASAGDAILQLNADGNQSEVLRTRRSLNRFEISGGGNPILIDNNGTAATNTANGGIHIKRTTISDMVDGFGGGVRFAIQDNAAVENEIAAILAVRDGADNSGHLEIWTKNAGAYAERLRMSPAGDIGFGTSTSSTVKLNVAASTTNAHAAQFVGNGTGSGVTATGGASGPGITAAAGGGGSPVRGALALTVQADPSAPVAGDFWVNSTDNIPRWRDGTSIRRAYPFTAFTSTASATLSSVTSGTFSTGSFTVPASALYLGAIIEAWATFDINLAAPSESVTLTMRRNSGGTAVATTGAIIEASGGSGQANGIVHVKFTFIVSAYNSSTGTFATHAAYILKDNLSSGTELTAYGVNNPAGGSLSISGSQNTTIAIPMDFQAAFSSSNASNTATLLNMWVKVI